MTLKEQILTIAAMVMLAYVCGIFLSVHRALFSYNKNRRLLLIILDILFCISQGLLIFVVLYYINGGQLRFYSFVIFLLTLLIYYRFHEKRVNKWIERVFYRIGQLFRIFVKVFNILFVKPVLGLLMILLFSVKILKNLLFMIGKILYILILRPILWILGLFIPRIVKEKARSLWEKIYNWMIGRFPKKE